jgi:hypothetical protein
MRQISSYSRASSRRGEWKVLYAGPGGGAKAISTGSRDLVRASVLGSHESASCLTWGFVHRSSISLRSSPSLSL